MSRALPCLLAFALAGCVSDATTDPEAPAAGWPDAPLADSEPRHEVHDLATGIGETWWFYVAAPGGPDAVVRFALEGPAGTPRSSGSVCLAHEMDLVLGDGTTRSSRGRSGDCGESLSVSVDAGLGETLFELRGSEVLPGTYRFEATGLPQAGSLVVDLAAR